MVGQMKKRSSLILVALIITSFYLLQPQKVHSVEPFFTLKYKSYKGVGLDYGNLLKQQLARIGINLEVTRVDPPAFLGEFLPFYDYDIFFIDTYNPHRYVYLYNPIFEPSYTLLKNDFSDFYTENGSYNYFRYHSSYDWDDCLETGINEWYLRHGNLVMPPFSKERIQHYWDWQEYLMDKVCLMAPALTPKIYVAHWSTLDGYNLKEGIINSLLLIATYILDFLCIHPFLDGNGRLSRLISLMLLYHNGHDVGKYISIEKI